MTGAFKALAFVLVGCSLSFVPQASAQKPATPAAAAPAAAAKPDDKPTVYSTKTEDVTYPSGKDTLTATSPNAGKARHLFGNHSDPRMVGPQRLGERSGSEIRIAPAMSCWLSISIAAKSLPTPDEAHELSRGVPQDRAMKDLQAAYDYMEARKDITKDRIAVIGWCMGGGYAVEFAVHQPRLSGVVVNYGSLPTDPNDLQQIAPPILGNFGADDKGITPADVHAFEDSMKKLGNYVEIKIYPGAGHAFENPNNTTATARMPPPTPGQRTTYFPSHRCSANFHQRQQPSS